MAAGQARTSRVNLNPGLGLSNSTADVFFRMKKGNRGGSNRNLDSYLSRERSSLELLIIASCISMISNDTARRQGTSQHRLLVRLVISL